MEGGRN